MKKSILLLGLAFVNVGLWAQEALSLFDAIGMGLENNYALKVVKNNEKIAGINNTWGNTSLMPTLDFSASVRENFNDNETENYREQTITPEISLRWVLFNGFSAKINKARYEELEAQSQGNTAILVESTIQDIILAYNNCLLQSELTAVYERLAELSADRYQRAEESRSIGTSTTYEVLQAKTASLEDQSNFLQQKVNFDNAVRTLNFAMAAENDALWSFSSPLSADTAMYVLEDLANKMMTSNATLQNQYVYQSLVEKERRLAQSNYWPSLTLNSGINNSDYQKFFQGQTANIVQNAYNTYVGLSLSWSIFNGGTRKRSVEIAKINEESALAETNQIKHSLNNQLMQMYSTYNVNKAILSLSNEQEKAARLNLELSEEKLKNGSINSFNYRDVQMTYMNAAVARLRALYNLLSSNTDLLRITGGILDEYTE